MRIALISSSPLILAGLRAGLEPLAECELVLSSRSVADAQQLGYGQADVLIVDCGSEPAAVLPPDFDDGGPAVVLLADDQAAADVADWLERGVSILPRDASLALVAAAARASAAGLVASSRALTAQAVRFARMGASRRIETGFEPLTPREQQVLAKMALGLHNREIAESLHVSAHTAKFHVAQIIGKLNAHSRGHAVAKALQAGLLED